MVVGYTILGNPHILPWGKKSFLPPIPQEIFQGHLCQVERHRLEDEAKEKPMRSLNSFFFRGRKLFNGYTHDGSMGMTYLPVYLVDFYGTCKIHMP